jgi:formylglycine-generating enzyme
MKAKFASWLRIESARACWLSRYLLGCGGLLIGVGGISSCAVVIGIDDLVADRTPSGGAGGNASTTTTTGGQCSGACGTPGCAACPIDDMVEVPAAAGTFLIDKNEVSNEDYTLFLAASPSLDLAPMPQCEKNVSFLPGEPTEEGWGGAAAIDHARVACDAWKQADNEDNKPVACVDWCDAAAYCKWANKRLCGKIGGADYIYGNDVHADASVSEWHAACAGSPEKAFPYGDTYESSFCNDVGNRPQPLDAFPMCEGGYPGIFNMSANVGEWENACSDFNSPEHEQNCLIRGGTYYKEPQPDVPDGDRQCRAFRDNPRFVIGNGVGFRCCADKPL